MMKTCLYCAGVLAIALATSPALAQEEGSEAAPAARSTASLSTDHDRLSYVIGYQVGMGLMELPELNLEVLVHAIRDVRAEVEPPMTQEEMQATLTQVMMQIQQEQMQRMEEEGASREGENQTFLEENAKRDGVITTESGLQYRVVTEGAGVSPTAADTVTVHYTGRLLDGTEFDSSHKRGEPATFQLGQVIRGWTEGLQLMKQGGKTELFVPADLAYGNRPPGGGIPPNALLIFEVELLEVKKAGNEVILEN